MVGLRTDLRVLQKLLAEEAPELAEHLDLEGRGFKWVGDGLRVECFTCGRSVARWWFQRFRIFIPTWGNDPI